MKIFQILMAAITAFAITSGGAYATVIVALSGQAVSQLALNMCIGLGIIAMIDPRLFRTAELEDGWKKAEPVDPPKP